MRTALARRVGAALKDFFLTQEMIVGSAASAILGVALGLWLTPDLRSSRQIHGFSPGQETLAIAMLDQAPPKSAPVATSAVLMRSSGADPQDAQATRAADDAPPYEDAPPPDPPAPFNGYALRDEAPPPPPRFWRMPSPPEGWRQAYRRGDQPDGPQPPVAEAPDPPISPDPPERPEPPERPG
jgi:hypothetical protein